MNLKSARLIACALLATGCVTAPKTDPQRVPIDETTLGLSGPALKPAGDGWWMAFGDPQLNRLVDEALAHNLTLAQSLARVRGAQAQAIAAGASLRPGFAVDANESRQRLSENYIYPPPGFGFAASGGNMAWLGEAMVNLSWNLDFWGRQHAVLEAARAEVHAAELDSAGARLALSGAIAQSYVQLYQSHEVADIAEQALRQREALLKIAHDRVRAGLGTDIEIANAEAAVPQARGARLQAEGSRDAAIHNLAALSGRGAEAYAEIDRPRLTLDAALPLPTELPLDLLAHRPDVLAAKARIEAATAGRKAAQAAFYPDISLRAFAGSQAVGLDELLKTGSRVFGIAPALHLPIFDSQRLKAGFLGKTAELDAAIAAYNDTVLHAIRDVSDQLSLGESLQRQLEQARKRLAATQDAHTLAERRYAAGLAPQSLALDAQTAWLDARRDIVSLTSNLATARVALLLTLGGSFDPSSPISTSPETAHVPVAGATP